MKVIKSFNIFKSGIGEKVLQKIKKFIDLSNCAGSLILGHNSKIFTKFKFILKK